MIKIRGLYSLWVFSIGWMVSTADEGELMQELIRGKRYLPTPVYSFEEDQRILNLFEGLRVADVSDAMDAIGLANIGLMDPEIHPLWKDSLNFTHRIIGIAVTVRYVPSREAIFSQEKDFSEFDRWIANWYSQKSPEPFIHLLRPGTVIVIEEAPNIDVGSIGSNNIMTWKLKGCVGVVTNGRARDTDEIIAQRIPLYYRKAGRGIRPGRNIIESVNCPIVCGGVTVVPGDVIVADGDGVIVVPRVYAEKVAVYARKTLMEDKAARRILYKQLGLPEDSSVR